MTESTESVQSVASAQTGEMHALKKMCIGKNEYVSTSK